ncbi:MAG: sortase family protein [Acidimicrobiales bacterium]|nr:sortase family protein [Acidimicrobiales bacterium]
MTTLYEVPAPPAETADGTPTPAPAATAARREPAADPWKADLWRWFMLTALALVALSVAVVFLDHFIAPVLARARHRALTADLLAQHGAPTPGQAAGLLQIPAIGLNAVVVEGDRPQDLRAGPGHRRGTPQLGQAGNTVLTGHTNRWGADFVDLAKLAKGDRIVVESRVGSPTAYVVTVVQQVGHDDVRLLRASTDHRITLVAGAGGMFSRRRTIVQAVSGSNFGLKRAVRPIPPDTAGPPLVGNVYALALLLTLGGAAFAASKLRGRVRALTVAIMVAPLVAGGLMALLLEVDLLLPALR